MRTHTVLSFRIPKFLLNWRISLRKDFTSGLKSYIFSVNCIWRLSFSQLYGLWVLWHVMTGFHFWKCDARLFCQCSVSSLALCEVVRLWPTNVRLVFTRTGLRWSASLLYLLQSDKGVLIDFEQQCCFSFTCYFPLSLIYYLKCTLAWRQHLGILRSLTLDPKKKI